MNKTVWYISKYANIKKFGAETRQASFCKEFVKVGYDVKLITSNSSHLYSSLPVFKGRYLHDSDSGFEVIWVNTPKYINATSLRRIFSWLVFEFSVISLAFKRNIKKPDVVIASSLSLFSVFSGCFYKFFYKSKFIFEVRDIWPQSIIDLKGISKNNPLIIFLSWIEKLGYKYADEIVGTMPGIATHVTSVIGRCDKVNCIPQGVDLSFYKNELVSVASDYFEKYIPSNKFIVTYAGTLGIANAMEYVIEAAKLIEKHNENIHFLFVGDGGEEKRLKELAAGLSNITFAPRVDKNQVQSVLNRSDVLIASVRDESIYRYGISLNKFIDYMYAQKVILCMYSGFPSMINEADCGEFTPAEDPASLVSSLIKYEGMRKNELAKLGSNGYRYLIHNRNFTTLAKQFMELFSD